MDDIHRAPIAPQIPPLTTWSDLRAVIGQQDLALFVDYDGTLTPIAPRPDLATLSEPIRDLLARLARSMPVTVITGRDLGDVKERVGLDDLIYVGSHGFDIEGPGIVRRPEAARDSTRALIARIGAGLAQELDGVPGLILEQKRFSAAVHYRLVAEQHVDPILTTVDRIAAGEPGLCVTKGKKLVELRPAVAWHKGAALFWVLQALGLDRDGVLPLFFGDDVTDEDAFQSLRDAGKGYGLVVSEQPKESYAQGRLSDTEDVAQILRQIADWAEARA